MKKLTCAERDAIMLDPDTGRIASGWGVASGLTDAYGDYGEPRIMTTWELNGRLIKDVRHPFMGSYSPPDREPCEHWESRNEVDE